MNSLMRVYYVPDAILGDLHILISLAPTTTLWNSYNSYKHSTNEDIDLVVKQDAQGHTAGKLPQKCKQKRELKWLSPDCVKHYMVKGTWTEQGILICLSTSSPLHNHLTTPPKFWGRKWTQLIALWCISGKEVSMWATQNGKYLACRWVRVADLRGG